MHNIEFFRQKIRELRPTCREQAFKLLSACVNRPDIGKKLKEYLLIQANTPVNCKNHPGSRKLGGGQCFACYQQRWNVFRDYFKATPVARAILDAFNNEARTTVRNARQRITQSEARKSDPDRFKATEDRRRGTPKRKASTRKAHLKKYGLTPEEFASMLKLQRNRCAICRIPQGVRRFHLDHCHTTGKTRGILCTSCNVGMGYFYHNTKSLNRAIKYINQ